MRKKHIVFILILIIITSITLCAFTACASGPKNDDNGGWVWGPPIAGTPGDDDGPAFYPGDSSDSTHEPDFDDTKVKENPVISTQTQNDLYFSVDTNTAGYTQLKNLILNERYYGSLANYVKIDQMLNYFHYDYSTPQDDELLAINASMFDSPYNSQKKLLRIGLTSKEVELSSAQNNIVLLLDVSGSMSGANKIELMKKAMIQMVENLNSDDKISIVTYSDRTKVIIDGMTIGENLNDIKRKINDLNANGGTNGEGGIQKAYEVAKNHFIDDGNNRIILATDGDFNIGISNPGELKEFISTKRNDGIYLTCIGLGYNSDYSTATMEALSKSGNGYWGYIHDMDDAKKLLVDDLASTIITIAKDVKAKIVFNADTVKNFRLLGYENNVISNDDYEDNRTDAGEIGTGFTLSLCFEIQLNDGVDLSQDLDIANVNVRYKDAKSTPEDISSELDLPIDSRCYTTAPTQDDKFVASVVEFALILLDSRYKADANLNNVIARLQSMEFDDESKTQFAEVVTTYKNNLNNSNLR
ncbi:MAG: von Willebrand factor type A domain-containing protein [Clostridia bacterium]|nr:von Willebrand factor type A domain-containing protein [Clostridia bacterium]